MTTESKFLKTGKKNLLKTDFYLTFFGLSS